ncbi:MAG: hypothetical protein GXO02_02925 [Epsilonproteobacteria bacterium]|nr:hypothetical protein [Campylobacterota bacterium]
MNSKKIFFNVTLVLFLGLNCVYGDDINSSFKSPFENNLSNDFKFIRNMGIETNDSKIIIDLKKVRTFLNQVAKKVEAETKEFGKKVKNGSEAIGIKTSKDKIEIDLNKSKSFLEGLINRFKKVIEDINSTLNKRQ